jgi:pimeloyl-ACP methyl ester carboxylesterase
MWRLTRYLGLALLALALGIGAWAWTPDLPRAGLEARYAAPPSRFVEVEGVRVHVRDTGPLPGTPSVEGDSRTPVLLLHGFGSSLHTWEDWAERLQVSRRVVRLDLPGFGLTGPDPTGDYSDRRAVVILSGLLDRLGLRQVDVVGSSMGGRIAWRLAAEKPDRVRRLVLMAPDGFASEGQRYGEAPGLPLAMRALPYTLPMPLLRQGLAAAYAEPASLREEVLQRYRDMLLAPGVRAAILDRVRDNVLEPPEPFLHRIGTPVLLLWGEQDRMVPASHAADYARELPDSRTVVLPGIGHVPMEEQPDRSLAALLQFLDHEN